MRQMTEYDRLRANATRAYTRHLQEQERGMRDGSVRQTRRMALASAAHGRAYGKLRRYERTLERVLTPQGGN